MVCGLTRAYSAASFVVSHGELGGFMQRHATAVRAWVPHPGRPTPTQRTVFGILPPSVVTAMSLRFDNRCGFKRTTADKYHR
jgi:hypothetical protein